MFYLDEAISGLQKLFAVTSHIRKFGKENHCPIGQLSNQGSTQTITQCFYSWVSFIHLFSHLLGINMAYDFKKKMLESL